MNLLEFSVLALTGRSVEGRTRQAVYALVRDRPGLHQRELARQLDLTASHAEHHLRHLVRAGLLSRQEDGRYVRYYVAAGVDLPGVAATDRKVVAVLRQARPLEVVARLLQGDMQAQEMAQAVGVSVATLGFHVKKLERVGLVRRRREGNQNWLGLCDRDATVATLLAYEPPADLVAGFEDLWDDVGSSASRPDPAGAGAAEPGDGGPRAA